MIIEEFDAKSLIRQSGPSIFSWAEIYLNPYQGCFHDCRYCDGKSEHYYMHDDFGTRIKVKRNAPELLIKYLNKSGFTPTHKKEQSAIYDFIPNLEETGSKYLTSSRSIICVGGGVCDVYQPAELETKMTRKLLEIIYNYQMPIWILTKSKFVLRDIDLIKEINKETYACVNFTITLANENEQKIFEPNASSTVERFDAIKTLRKEGIHSGIYFYPVLPFIGDKNENFSAIYNKAKEVNAEFVYCSGLTLKPGRSKDEFMNILKEFYPNILTKYQKLYGNNNKYGHLDYDVFKEMNLVWPEIKGFKYGYENGLGYSAERYVPEGRSLANLKISELLRKIAYLKGAISHEQKFNAQNFMKAANFIENLEQEITELEKDDFEESPLTYEVLTIIRKYVFDKESKYLENLEVSTYNKIKEKFFE